MTTFSKAHPLCFQCDTRRAKDLAGDGKLVFCSKKCAAEWAIAYNPLLTRWKWDADEQRWIWIAHIEYDSVNHLLIETRTAGI